MTTMRSSRCVWCVGIAALAMSVFPSIGEEAQQAVFKEVETKAETVVFALSELHEENDTVLDLGEIIRSKTVEVEFELLNDSESQLTMTAVRSGCGCTEIDSWPMTMMPGETGLISGVFTAPKRAGVRRDSELSLVRGGELFGRVTVSAMVVEPIRVEATHDGDEIRIHLASRDGAAFRVLDVEPADLGVEFDSKREDPRHTVFIKTDNWTRAGTPKRAVFFTTHQAQAAVRIDLRPLLRENRDWLVEGTSGDSAELPI